MAPVFQLAGTAQSGVNTLTVAWPTHLTNDIGILVIETGGEGTTLSITAPTGWVAITGSPVTDVATVAGSKLQVWWKRAASAAETSVTVPDSGDHQVAAIFTFRGCIPTGNPWNVATTGTKTTASTTATVPSLTTTVPDTLVVAVVGRPDDSASTTHFGTLTNANLTGIGAGGEAGTTAGHGGGFAVKYGTFASVGSTGTSTLTKTVSTTDTYMALALRAAASLTADKGTFTLTGRAANLLKNSRLTANKGTFTETGSAASLLRKYSLSASAGSFSQVGQDATFSRSYSLSANAGSFAEVGQAATLTRGLKLTAADTPSIVTSGLALNLDAGNTASYPGSGTTWTDLSGNGNNGTLVNGPTFDSANGGSLVFDGTNDYVSLGTPSQLNQAQVPLTICGWAKLNSTSGARTIWGVYKNTTGGQLYSLFRVDSGTLYYFASDSSGNFQYQSGFSISAGAWNFYAVTVSGTISSPTVTVYLNNSSQSFSYSAFTSSPDATIDFRIGGAQAFLNECWNGNISNISWYNRALTSDEVTQNYNALRGRFDGSGTGGAAYAFTGNAATLTKSANTTLTATAGAFSFVGNAAGLRVTRTFGASVGSFNAVGNAASLKRGYRLTAEQGAYTVTGNAATPKRTVLLTSSSGSFALTGIAASPKVTRYLSGGGGTFIETGQSAGLNVGRKVTGAASSYALVGNAATLTKSATSKTLSAATGAFASTGNAAGLYATRKLASSAGTYSETGQAAGLRATRTATAAPGAFSLTGNAATFSLARKISASTGSFTLAGQGVGFNQQRRLTTSVGSFTLVGNSAQLKRSLVMLDAAGTFTLIGSEAYLTKLDTRPRVVIFM